MKEFTKEQEKEIEQMLKKNENETNYVCLKCKKRFIGMKEVRVHVDKVQHHEYQPLRGTSKMRLIVG